MLFPLQRPGVMRMWMKDTLIPLDMLFIDAHGQIIYIRERRDAPIGSDHHDAGAGSRRSRRCWNWRAANARGSGFASAIRCDTACSARRPRDRYEIDVTLQRAGRGCDRI
jgi:hypothetical protein